MIVDWNTAQDTDVIETDICIIGAGAAGITLSMELDGGPLKVLLLEGGDLEYSDRSQEVYQGTLTDERYPDLDVCRLRFLGGTTNHWGGSCCMLDEIDFEYRSWVPDSGWPFSRKELMPSYQKAKGYLDLADVQADQLNEMELLDVSPAVLKQQLVWHSAPTRFGSKYRPRLSRSKNVTLAVNANAVEVIEDKDGTEVSGVKVMPFGGTPKKVAARYVVLAMGGIENARLLLASNAISTNGIGNEADLVGRYFMDHPVIEGAVAYSSSGYLPPVYSGISVGGRDVSMSLSLADSLVKREHLMNVKMPFDAQTNYYLSEGINSYHYLRRTRAKGEKVEGRWRHLATMLGDLDMVAEAVSRKKYGKRIFDHADDIGGFLIDTMIEQTPDRNSRVTLSDTKDELGLPKVSVDWRFQDRDRENLRRSLRYLAIEFARLQRGRVKIQMNDDIEDRLFDDLMSFGNHHMGTTRASTDRKKGVVDGNLRVHGRRNLFVAGSSVFPTGGHVPPTMTIVALSIRLAGHLRERFGVSDNE